MILLLLDVYVDTAGEEIYVGVGAYVPFGSLFVC